MTMAFAEMLSREENCWRKLIGIGNAFDNVDK
jgi:hypothetical protein